MHEDEKGRKIGQQKKKKKKERKKEGKKEKEEEKGMVPSKDPLRKPGVESNHQPFDLESNALPLALPGLAHANTRTISTKNPFFISIFTLYRLHLKFRSEALGAVAGGEGLERVSRGRAVTVQEVAMLAVRPEGKLRGPWETRGILVDKVRGQLSGDELVG